LRGIRLRRPNGEFILLARSNIIALPSGKVSEEVDEQWAMIQEDFDKLYSLSGADRIGIGSGGNIQDAAKRWEMFQSTSSWPTSGGFSSMGVARPIGRRFLAFSRRGSNYSWSDRAKRQTNPARQTDPIKQRWNF